MTDRVYHRLNSSICCSADEPCEYHARHASSNRADICDECGGRIEVPTARVCWRKHAIPNSAAEHNCKHVLWLDGREWADCSCGWQSPESHATPNRADDYPEDLRWRQHIEDEIVCLQEAVADLQRRMAT